MLSYTTVCSGALVVLHGAVRLAIAYCSIVMCTPFVRAGGKAIRCNDSLKATTPFFGTNSRRAARADRESVARLDPLLETIVDQQEALLVHMLRGCAQAVVDAPLAQKLALREDFAQMELDAMKQCSALFDALRPRPRSRDGSIIPERLSASQVAPSMQWKEAKRGQDDDERLEEDERRWRVAKAADNTATVDVTEAPPPPAPPRRTSKRVAEALAAEEAKQADAVAPVLAAEAERQVDAAAPAPAAPRLDAAKAALEACRASRAVVAAKREDKKKLRRERDQRRGDAKAARCQCPSTCVLEGVSYRRLRRGSSASTR